MGCSSENTIEIEEVKKDENDIDNEDLIDLKGDKNKPEIEVLERKNYDMGPKSKEDEPVEEENKNEIAVENEEEEIIDNIKVDEEEIIEYKNNNTLKVLEKSNQELKGSSCKIKTDTNNETKKKIKANKNQKNAIKKSPFIISEIQSSPYQKIKIRINACSFIDEYMMPIWCPKGVYIKFRVEGKWRLDNLYDYTDSKGIPSNHSSGFNYGALIGRIGLDKKIDKQFIVTDEGTFLVKKGGPLFLRQNLPKNMKISPEGNLDVSIYDGVYMTIDEINNKLGWIETATIEVDENEKKEQIKTNEKVNNEKISSSKKGNQTSIEIEAKELEKKVRTHFNNLRMNPSLFYEKYLKLNSKYFYTEEYLKKKLKIIQRNNLVSNQTCYNYLGDYFELPNQIQIKKTLNKNNIAKSLSYFATSLSYNLYDKMNSIVITKCIITQKDNQNDIIIQYLLDKKFKDYIFDEKSRIMIVKIIKNFFNNSNLVVVAIILDKYYSNKNLKNL